jgi:hypothetical protein
MPAVQPALASRCDPGGGLAIAPRDIHRCGRLVVANVCPETRAPNVMMAEIV